MEQDIFTIALILIMITTSLFFIWRYFQMASGGIVGYVKSIVLLLAGKLIGGALGHG